MQTVLPVCPFLFTFTYRFAKSLYLLGSDIYVGVSLLEKTVSWSMWL